MHLLDPAKNKTIRLSKRAAAALVHEKLVELTPRSPLAQFVAGDAAPSDAERSEGKRELFAQGLSFAADAAPNLHLRALQAVGQPRRLVQLSLSTPQQKGAVEHALYGDVTHLATVALEKDVLLIGPAISNEELAELLRKPMEGPPPADDKSQQDLFPDVLQVTAALWPESGRKASEFIPLIKAKEVLVKNDVPPADTQPFLDELAENEVVTLDAKGVHLHPALGYWLNLLWSGHSVQLEKALLPDDPEVEPSEEDVLSFMFVGPPGQRVYVEQFAVEPDEGEPVSEDEPMLGVTLTHLISQELDAVLAAFLDLEVPEQAAEG